MERITLTETDLMNARDYVPLMEKAEFLTEATGHCFERLRVMVPGIDNAPMPDMWKENPFVKERFLMGALMKMYLKGEYDPVEGTHWLMSADDYDRVAGSHIMNQMERMKTSPDLRGKVFDLLKDFRGLRSMLDREIHGLLAAQNDPVARFIAAMESRSDPEAMQEQLLELQKLAEEIEKSRKAQTGEGEGDG